MLWSCKAINQVHSNDHSTSCMYSLFYPVAPFIWGREVTYPGVIGIIIDANVLDFLGQGCIWNLCPNNSVSWDHSIPGLGSNSKKGINQGLPVGGSCIFRGGAIPNSGHGLGVTV